MNRKQRYFTSSWLPVVFGGLFLCLACPPLSQAKVEEAAKQDDYLPEIVKYLKQYAPVYTQAEEPEWMGWEGMHRVYSGKVDMAYEGLSWYKPCLEEAIKGNPRGMVCVAAIAEITEAERQRAMFPTRPDIPAAAYTGDYWLAWATRYMPPGWAETRLADIFWGGMGAYNDAIELNYPEAGYRATLHGASTSPALLYAANAGWPDALGVAAHWLESGGGGVSRRVFPQKHYQGPRIRLAGRVCLF